jgi:hypothetical protein
LLWTRPSSRGWTEPCELAVCMLPAACPRRRADPPSPESRAEPVACRCRCRHRRASPFSLRSCRSFVSTCVVELGFAAGTHTTEHAPSSQGLAFLRPGVV